MLVQGVPRSAAGGVMFQQCALLWLSLVAAALSMAQGQTFVKFASTVYPPAGYRLATCSEAAGNQAAVLGLVSYLDICGLNGGDVRGSRQGYDNAPGNTVICPDPDPPSSFGCYIYVRPAPTFIKVQSNQYAPAGYSLATCQQAQAYQAKVLALVSYLDICGVSGGDVRGSRQGYDNAPGNTVLCPDPNPPSGFGCSIYVQQL